MVVIVGPQTYSPISALLAVLHIATLPPPHTHITHTHTKLTFIVFFLLLLSVAAASPTIELSFWAFKSSHKWPASALANHTSSAARGRGGHWSSGDGGVGGSGRVQHGQKGEMGGDRCVCVEKRETEASSAGQEKCMILA